MFLCLFSFILTLHALKIRTSDFNTCTICQFFVDVCGFRHPFSISASHSDFSFFDQNAARSTVPGGPSVACSTAKAVEWDAAWSKNLDPSGRAALGVHLAAYEDAKESKMTASETSLQKLQAEKTTVAV